jgi:hypothetical protein
MNLPRIPRLAVALLERAGVDPVLIGDIVEEFERRRSRLWLWRQVIASLALAILGRGREPQPHIRRTVSLTGLPAGIPVGGLGLAVLIGLVTVVSPRSWWIVAAAAAGGAVLGVVMILSRRARQRPPSATIGLHGDARLGRADGGHTDAGAVHRS